MIQLVGLHKIYRTANVETTALNGINLEVPIGEFLGIMGPSGCGKSTLLNVIGMLDNATSGSYLFEKSEVVGLDEWKRADLRRGKIGYIFQNFNLIDELSVFGNVELPLIYMKMTKKERQNKVEALLERFEIKGRSGHYPQELSGGQQQRVAIARSLVTDPLIVLADEPTGNLDSENGKIVMESLRNLNKTGTTILMVTHSKQDSTFCSRVIELKDGSLIN